MLKVLKVLVILIILGLVWIWFPEGRKLVEIEHFVDLGKVVCFKDGLMLDELPPKRGLHPLRNKDPAMLFDNRTAGYYYGEKVTTNHRFKVTRSFDEVPIGPFSGIGGGTVRWVLLSDPIHPNILIYNWNYDKYKTECK